MGEWAGIELVPGKDAKTDNEIADYLRKTHNTSTTGVHGEMGAAADDPMAVLDARLRVRGVDTVSAWPTARRCRSWSR
jgi:choline oxidase